MICVSMAAAHTGECMERLRKAEALADIVEIRLDASGSLDIPLLLRSKGIALLFTYRTKGQGGFANRVDPHAISIMKQALDLGADYVDVESSWPLEYLEELKKVSGGQRLIYSHHILDHTPPFEELVEMVRHMAKGHNGIIKLIPMATDIRDNIQVLKLCSWARSAGIRLISFCMGELGVLSRVLCLQAGSIMTFASLEDGSGLAPGQIPALTMKVLLAYLGKEINRVPKNNGNAG